MSFTISAESIQTLREAVARAEAAGADATLVQVILKNAQKRAAEMLSERTPREQGPLRDSGYRRRT